MKRMIVLGCLPALMVLCTVALAADSPDKKSPKEALRALNDLIGNWRGTGEPNGTREEKQRNFWQEKIGWEWRFKGKDVYLHTTFEKGKYFSDGELRYLPDKDRYQLTATTTAKDKRVFEGTLDHKKCLTLERQDDRTKETQRLVVSLFHFNRYVYRYEVKPADRATFREVYHVGATKEGVEFAGDDDKPECVVSGGLGTMPVTFKGKTYYVCCSGCRDAFNDEPEKYVKEFEARKNAKKKASER